MTTGPFGLKVEHTALFPEPNQVLRMTNAGGVVQQLGRSVLSDEDYLLQWIGGDVRETELGSMFDSIEFDSIAIAEAAKRVTRNLRTSCELIVWASGNYFVDAKGKIFLDFCAQTQNLNFGHNHPRLREAATQFFVSETPYYTSSKFGNFPCTQLINKLAKHLPAELNRINLKMLNGADAVETALKSALQYHAQNGRDRRKIVSLRWAHHGQSAMVMACSNKYIHLPYVSCPNNIHLDANDIEQLRQHVTADAGVAALVLEPLQMNGGAVPMTAAYLEEARRICTREDVVLIFDEIQTAFGWTGKLFGFEHYGVVPDILCLSKALASGFPLSAAVMREQYDTLNFGEAEFTGGLNPLSATIALANIDILTNTDVMQRVPIVANRLRQGLQALADRFPRWCKEVRGLGMMQALETQSYAIAKQIYDHALEKGVLLRISKDGKGEAILIKPSLVVSNKQIDKVLEVMTDAFKTID